ncbi:MAG: HlyD family efflux transporter periplasmic adaptor subunit [Myxococcales bacterium]|nr:HlyD family efflux transporter periplasmic adaptor subunit [Myxococcales bacterium]
MRRWITRIIVGAVLLAIVAVLVWSMWPQPVPVEVAPVTRTPLRITVDEDGRARVEDRYLVAAPLAGTLGRIELRAGDPVAAGAVVARIAPLPAPLLDPRTRVELTGRVDVARAQRRQAEATVERARINAEYAARERDRLRPLVAQQAVPGIELDRADLTAEIAARDLSSAQFAAAVARHALTTAEAMAARTGQRGDGDDVLVEAPVSGQVLRVLVPSAGAVAPGTPLLELGDPHHLEIVADVLTADAVAIQPGASATITGWGGPPVAGRVRRVEPSATTRLSALGVEEQRVDVVIDLTAPPQAWAGLGDGWRVEVAIVTVELPEVTAVPLGALRRAGDGWSVYVVADGVARRRVVTLGQRNAEVGEVTAGLAVGERVILHPGERITDGVRVRAR